MLKWRWKSERRQRSDSLALRQSWARRRAFHLPSCSRYCQQNRNRCRANSSSAFEGEIKIRLGLSCVASGSRIVIHSEFEIAYDRQTTANSMAGTQNCKQGSDYSFPHQVRMKHEAVRHLSESQQRKHHCLCTVRRSAHSKSSEYATVFRSPGVRCCVLCWLCGKLHEHSPFSHTPLLKFL